MLVKEFMRFVVADRHLGGQFVLVEHHKLGAHHFRQLVALGLGGVVGADSRVVDFHRVGKLLRAQHPGADVTRLANQLVEALNACPGHQRGAGNAVELLLNQDV